jgi:hypothetical protein
MAQFKRSTKNHDRALVDHTEIVHLAPGLSPGGTMADAFGRLRVSEAFSLLDSQHRYRENDDWSTANTAGGRIFHHANTSCMRLVVNTTNGASVVRETKRVFLYQSGKSILTMHSFVMAPPKDGLRQRVGYFSSNNGVYLESLGANTYLVLRSQSSGPVVNTRVLQTNWNFDTFSNTSYVAMSQPRGYAGLNVASSNIFWCDLEWLGVGDVRCGFVIGGQLYLAHTFSNHSGVAAYMTTATLPCRREITNVTATASQSVMQEICTTVITESGFQARGNHRSSGYELNALKTLTAAGTYYPIISVRLAAGRLDTLALIEGFVFISITNNANFKFKIIMNTTLTGPVWNESDTRNIETSIAATALSGGTTIESGFINSAVKGTSLDLTVSDPFRYQLGRTLTGVSDIITLAVTSDTPGAAVGAIVNWTEYT